MQEWTLVDVGWDRAHDEGSHGSHHARVATFLRENSVQVVAVDHVGEGMRRMLPSLGIRLVEGVAGPARAATISVAAGIAGLA